ncbi:MAG: Cmk3 [Parcubacteria group bacterium GW2011_GWA2_42_28]|nr:MAG: Cmk3 [Parcubacteria group bacterium GW2011_GWA2_42_28]
MHHEFRMNLSQKLLAKAGILVNRPLGFFKKEKPRFPPFITISRESGSGGRPIAEMVAKALKFELLDESLAEEVAKSAKKRKELIESVDEKSRGLVTDVIQSVLNPEYISDITYIRHVTRVILLKAHKGKVVILGRGANFMIPSEAGLRVRIQAPYKIRVKRAIKYEKIDFDRARDIIQKVDTERKEFVRQYFGKNISNANFYDLILNTEHMTMEDARDLILLAFKRKFRLQ